MLVSTPPEEVSNNLSHQLRSLPTLIDVYVLIVDRVMRKHGFDPEKCEFIPEQAFPVVEFVAENLIQNPYIHGPEVYQIDSALSAIEAESWSATSERDQAACEQELLAVAS